MKDKMLNVLLPILVGTVLGIGFCLGLDAAETWITAAYVKVPAVKHLPEFVEFVPLGERGWLVVDGSGPHLFADGMSIIIICDNHFEIQNQMGPAGGSNGNLKGE